MVEVFSTNLPHPQAADFLRQKLRHEFPTYDVHFDLEDCDNILRVACETASIDVVGIISAVEALGFVAHMLPDEPAPWDRRSLSLDVFA